MLTARDRLIFPLDVAGRSEALRLIRLLAGEVGLFKVGLELFVATGPDFLHTVYQESGTPYFLDLKFHDIPATVQGALHSAAWPGVRFVTVHCDQGPALLQAVTAGLAGQAQVLGVTLLTSLAARDLPALGYDPAYAKDPAALVLLRARMAQAAGAAGVVCSGREARAVKDALGPDFLVVTPGIRPAWGAVAADDQQRIATPAAAIQAGADYLVVGRPIRQAPDPVQAARQVVAEITAALAP